MVRKMQECWIIKASWSYADDSNYYMIWLQNDDGNDYIFTQNRKIIRFYNEKDAQLKINELGFVYMETVEYDFERLWYWIETGSSSQIYLPFSEQIDCEFLLNFWNIFSDIAFSVGDDFEVKSDFSNKIYNKLFYGLNLPAITPEDSEYIPIFDENEIEYLRELMKCGINLLEKSFYETF